MLVPPPGAAFTGNTAEWIMEAPDFGEPISSLPKFSPLQFTGAQCSGPGGASGGPSQGDVWTVSGFGTTLTAVTLATGCHQYWFLVTDGDGATVTFPTTGAITVPVGTTCATEYVTPATAASCAAADLNADGKIDLACIGSATTNLKWYENLGDSPIK